MSAPAKYPELPELPKLDPKLSIPYGSIRYICGYAESTVHQFMTDYAIKAIDAAREQDRARAAAPEHDQLLAQAMQHFGANDLPARGVTSEEDRVLRKAAVSSGKLVARAAAPQAAVGLSDEQIEAVTLQQRIDEIAGLFGSLREAAGILGIDVGYLSRLRSGEKTDPGPDVLVKLGLQRNVTYTRVRRAYRASPLTPRTRSA